MTSPPSRPRSEFVSDLALRDATPDEEERRPKPPLVGLWFVLSLAAVTAGGMFAKQKTAERAVAERRAARTATFVRTRRPIPRFQRITADDVVMMKTPTARMGAIPRTSAVVGRVAVAPLDSGVVVMERSTQPLAGEWWIVSVPAEAGLALAAGDSVALLGGATADSLVLQHDVVALGMEGAKAVVAMPPVHARSVARYLGKEPRLLAVRRIAPATPAATTNAADATRRQRPGVSQPSAPATPRT